MWFENGFKRLLRILKILIFKSCTDLCRKDQRVSGPMGIDKRGVSRGKCTQCNECEEYETSSSSVLCEYCGHRPVQHEMISSSRARAGPELEPPEKWAKSAKEGEEVIVVDNVEVCENDKTHMEDDLVSKL